MGVAEIEASCDFPRVRIFSTSKVSHPQPGPGDCEDKSMVQSPRRGGRSTRNDDLLARPRLWSRKGNRVDLRRVTVLAWLAGRQGGCRNLPDDVNLKAVNHDSLDGVSHQRARLGAPNACGLIGQELGSRQLPAQDLDDKPLDMLRANTGARARLLPAIS